ncbi:MAG: PAS domain-containing protein [Ekhidna sp.]
MESTPIPNSKGNYVLDRRIRSTLSNAKISLCEFNLTNRSLSWSVDESFYFYDFSKSYDGSIEGYFKLIHDDDKERINEIINNLNFGESVIAEHRVLWPDGTYHWLEGIGRTYEENGIARLVGTLQDITERKQLENEKADWEKRHRLVAEAAGIIVYDYHIDSGKILWSGNVNEVTSFTSEEMGDIKQWGELIHPDDRENAFGLLEEAENSLSKYEVYYRFMKKDGTYCHMYDRGTFISRGGKAVSMLGMMSDVSEIVLSKNALLESERKFESLMNNLNVGVGLYDISLLPKTYNRAAYQLLGLTEEQFIGRDIFDPNWNVIDGDGNRMNPDNFPIPQAIEIGLAVRQVVMGVYRPLMKDRVWLMVDAEPIFNEDHELQHVICTYTDFSARRGMEEMLKEKNRQLLVTSEEMSRRNERLVEFAQIVSHNLRSPLSNIAGLSELYFNSNQEEKETSVQFIKDVCAKALDTIDDLNEILKVQQSDRLEVVSLLFDNAFKSAAELIKIKVLERNVEIETDFKQAPQINYPEIYLESVFMNLLSNAIKYTHRDATPRIKVMSKKQGNDIILLFSDKGRGIDLNKYGDDIFSFGKTFHDHKNSKGVGLFLVKNQIRTMGDFIEVDSEIDNGTTFKITFKNQINEK